MANADSASNMLWLINQATAGEITNSGQGRAPTTAAEKSGGAAPAQGTPSAAPTDSAFNTFKIDMNA